MIMLAAARRHQNQVFVNRPIDAAFARAGRGLIAAFIFVSIILIFVISDMALAVFGFNYGEVGGSPIEKVHPGTWLAILALIAIGAGRGNPLIAFDMLIAHRGVAIFLACWVALLAYTILISKAPFTPLIDTFLLPIVLVAVIGWLEPGLRRRLSLTLHFILLLNALIGIYEYASGWRLTPYMIGSTELFSDWRSTALFGHPLANASVMGSYIVALAVGGGRDLPRLTRPLLMAISLVSMAAFGGRSSLVIALALVALAGLARSWLVLRGHKLDLLTSACVFLSAPALAMAVLALVQSGYFDQFIDRFSNDRGSAQARVIMLNLFKLLSWTDLLLGPDQAYLGSLQALEGIEFGIESFWVGFIMTHGIIMSTFFFVALAVFCWQLVALTRPATIMLLIFYFAVASTAVSMSAKTTIFGMFVAMTLLHMRQDAPVDRQLNASRQAAR